MAKKHGHHGGAWKVAYADFVTAMMALFLVLWLTSQDEKIKEAVARSFRNPFSSVTKESVGIIPQKDVTAAKDRSGNFDSASAVELTLLRKLNEDIKAQLEVENQDDKTVELELTPDGLKINVFDRGRKPVFLRDSKELTPYGEWVFSTLAWQISRFKNFAVELEGHTEARDATPRNDYDSWTLSSDRANTARKKLIESGVSAGQIRKIAGYADTMPMPNMSMEDESNRRVTVMLRINDKSKKNGG